MFIVCSVGVRRGQGKHVYHEELQLQAHIYQHATIVDNLLVIIIHAVCKLYNVYAHSQSLVDVRELFCLDLDSVIDPKLDPDPHMILGSRFRVERLKGVLIRLNTVFCLWIQLELNTYANEEKYLLTLQNISL